MEHPPRRSVAQEAPSLLQEAAPPELLLHEASASPSQGEVFLYHHKQRSTMLLLNAFTLLHNTEKENQAWANQAGNITLQFVAD